jgi:Fe-S cluster assembly protein SufD
LVERYVSLGDSSYFTNLAVDIHLGEGAVLRHHYVQEESPSAYHMRSQRLTQSADSAYEGLGCAIGAGWSRADWRVDFAGSGASCALRGLYVVGDRQLADNHLDMHHRVPRCTSQEDFRGVLNGRGRAVFDGRIVVHQDAQQTDARLRNDNLMLSRDAEVDTKPQLEIFADDVACSHGTTVGQIEPEQLFYLRSRGIPEAQAKRMICLGFAQSVLEGVSIPALVNHLGKVVGERLASEVNV